MITEAVLNILFLLVLGIVNLFPAFPRFELESLNGVIRVLSLIDTFVSLHMVSICIVAVLVVYNIRLLWSAIMWVARKLPFVK